MVRRSWTADELQRNLGMAEEKGPRPSHELKVLDLETNDTARVGVAWERDTGFSIKLNPGVVLSYDSMKGKILSLFKIRTEEEWKAHVHAVPALPVTSGSPAKFKKQNPDYVRKVHFGPHTARECGSRVLGRASVSDDPEKVTCRVCSYWLKHPNAAQVPAFLKEAAKGPVGKPGGGA